MDRDADPALQFFPDGEVDLYGALGVTKEATQEEVKKAYRKTALRYHPDKVLSSSSSSASADAHTKFQQIGFAYSVLSSESRRKRYDSTGRTNESMFEDADFSWDDYFKEMWQGTVSGAKLDEFKRGYQHSSEERADVLQAYTESKGDLEEIFTRVPCSEVLVDEERFVSIINEAIAKGEVEDLKQWRKSTGDAGARKNMRQRAQKEASEAEEYAKELGVWDDLYGSRKGKAGEVKGKGKGKAAKRKAGDDDDDDDDEEEEEEAEVVGDASSDEDEGDEGDQDGDQPQPQPGAGDEDDDDDDDDDEPVQPKKRARKEAPSTKKGKTKAASTSKAKASSSSKAASKGKSAPKSKKPKSADPAAAAAADDDDDEDLGGLRALMMKRGAARQSGFDAMIARLEAQSGGGSGEGKGKGKGKGGGKGTAKARGGGDAFGGAMRGEDEPDEEAFLKARERVDARKREVDEGRAGGGAGAGAGAGKGGKAAARGGKRGK